MTEIQKFCQGKKRNCWICKLADLLGLLEDVSRENGNIFAELKHDAEVMEQIITYAKGL